MTDTPKKPENETFEDTAKRYGEKILTWTSPDRWLPKRARPNPDEIIYGTLNDRMFAYAVDAAIITLLFFQLFQWISHYVDDTGSSQLMSNALIQGATTDQLTRIATETEFVNNLIKNYLLQFTFVGCIIVGFWHYAAATPGKWLIRLRVVNEADGIPIKAGQAALRYVSYFASPMLGMTVMFTLFPLIGQTISMLAGLITALAGLLWIGWDDKKQGWHDKIAGTCVIKVKHWRFKASQTTEYPQPLSDIEDDSSNEDMPDDTPKK